MTNEQITRANEIQKTLSVLKPQLERWEKANDFYNRYENIHFIKEDNSSKTGSMQIDFDLIDSKSIFFVVRAMAIQKLSAKISKLEKEFASL